MSILTLKQKFGTDQNEKSIRIHIPNTYSGLGVLYDEQVIKRKSTYMGKYPLQVTRGLLSGGSKQCGVLT